MSQKPLLDYEVHPPAADSYSLPALPPAMWVLFGLVVAASYFLLTLWARF